MSRVRFLLTFPLAAAWLLPGCGGGDLFLPEGDGSIAIRVVDGDGQRGSIGQPLDSPVVVEVTDEDGNPVAGVTVEFAFTSAGDGGEIAPATARTTDAGRAQAHLLLGDKVGLQTGEARVLVQSGIEPITSFSALADAGDDGPEPPPPPGNKAPQAEFQVNCTDLRCSFADRSTDEDGSIESRSWAFGDGATSTERNPSHTYASAGQYSVVLVVTDDDGATDDRTRTAAPQAPSEPPPPSNDPPSAEFEAECQELRCTFVDRSDDEDGNIVSWSWDFGDGATSTARNPSHSYASGGTYQVLLLVTDDDGAADTRTHSVRAEDPAPPPPPPPPPPPDPENQRPKAEFRVDCGGLTCVFQDESEDEDGSIVSWSWSFGDGATSTERNPTHTYSSKGKYEVLLTVTDDQGAADTKERRADPKD